MKRKWLEGAAGLRQETVTKSFTKSTDKRADELISGSLKLKRGNSREKIIDIYYYDCDAVDVCPACDGRFPG